MTLMHSRSTDGPWGLFLCSTPRQAYILGLSHDPAAVRNAAKVRMEKTTTLDADQVTCPQCLEDMANRVEDVLDTACIHPNAASHYHTCPDCGENPFPGQ